MTINYSSGNDIVIPTTNNTTYRGLSGDDTYVVSRAISANSSITIIDTKGLNIIQLIDGLTISSSKFSSDAFKIILSNGSSVTINGALNFHYEVGGNVTSGIRVDKKNYLAPNILMSIYAKKIKMVNVSHYKRTTGDLNWSFKKLITFCSYLIIEIATFKFKK